MRASTRTPRERETKRIRHVDVNPCICSALDQRVVTSEAGKQSATTSCSASRPETPARIGRRSHSLYNNARRRFSYPRADQSPLSFLALFEAAHALRAGEHKSHNSRRQTPEWAARARAKLFDGQASAARPELFGKRANFTTTDLPPTATTPLARLSDQLVASPRPALPRRQRA